MLNDEIPILQITFNPADLQNSIVLALAGKKFKVIKIKNSAIKFTQIIAIINPIAVQCSKYAILDFQDIKRKKKR